MKTITKVSISALIFAAASSAVCAFNLSGIASAVNSAVPTSSETTTAAIKSIDDFSANYIKACGNIVMSRSYIEDAAGDADNAKKYKTDADALAKHGVLDASKTARGALDGGAELIKKIDATSDSSKSLLQKGLESLATGTAQESALANELGSLIENTKNAMKSADVLDKAKLAEKIQPLIDLAKSLPTDAASATAALAKYLGAASEKGVTVSK